MSSTNLDIISDGIYKNIKKFLIPKFSDIASDIVSDIDNTQHSPESIKKLFEDAFNKSFENFDTQKETPCMDEDSFISDLERDGYVVIPDILSKYEIETAYKMFQDWRKSVTDLELQHKTSDPHGIYKHHEVGHQRHAWYIRTNPKVKKVFSDIWKHYGSKNPEELITSFDGSCYIPSDWNKRDNYWTHTDQGSPSGGEEDHFKCIQGFVSLTHNQERTFRCYRGSHKLHSNYFKEKGIKSKTNWHVIDENFTDKIQEDKIALKVKAGSLVLWDSRTFHQNQYGKLGNGEERIVQYVCMFPRSHPDNTKSVQLKREKYFQERRTTSHWPCPVKVNGKQPQTYGDDRKLIDYDNLPKPDLEDMLEEIRKLI